VDVRALPPDAAGLRLAGYTDVAIRQPITLGTYLGYMPGETNVEHAIAGGACTAGEARAWCRETLEPVFAAGEITVVVPGRLATLTRG
jgi:hypothetical protein